MASGGQTYKRWSWARADIIGGCGGGGMNDPGTAPAASGERTSTVKHVTATNNRTIAHSDGPRA